MPTKNPKNGTLAAAVLSCLLAGGTALASLQAVAATSVQIDGEISRITLATPGDY